MKRTSSFAAPRKPARVVSVPNSGVTSRSALRADTGSTDRSANIPPNYNFQRHENLLAFLSTLNPQLSTVFAQGPLTPPGPPAPTMKTLEQIEPRTEIKAGHTPGDADSQFKITRAGSYYLSSNIGGDVGKNCIEIAAGDVTLE
jgi:hypothetical protein